MTSCTLIRGRDDYKRPWRLPCSSSLALSVLGGHSESTAYQVSLLYNCFGYRTLHTSRTLRSASMWSCHYSCLFSYHCLTFLTFRSRFPVRGSGSCIIPFHLSRSVAHFPLIFQAFKSNLTVSFHRNFGASPPSSFLQLLRCFQFHLFF